MKKEMMSNRKTFCILEQGGYPGEELTERHKQQFNTDVSDFYRLNFKTEDDPNAFITGIGTTHMEGRNLLYKNVPKNYDYYIFIDDDVSFKEDDIATKIHNLLVEYKPISGTFYDADRQWHCPRNMSKSEQTEVHPICSFDLAVRIFSQSCADVLFPRIWHCEDIPRFNQYAIYKLYPKKQMMFYDIRFDNDHSRDQDLLKFDDPSEGNQFLSEIVDNEIWDEYHKSGHEWKKKIFNINKQFLGEEVSKEEVVFTLEDYGKIVDINSDKFKNRKCVYEHTNI